MQIAILGLGKMGRLLVDKLMNDGHQVVVWNRSHEVLDRLKVEKADFVLNRKLVIVRNVDELQGALLKPRVIWSMLPAGAPTNEMLEKLGALVDQGDILIDGGNSHFKDSQKQYDEFTSRGIKFLSIGVSGGVHGFENGFCLMASGPQDSYEYIRQILDSLSKPNGGHSYFGTGAAGHYVKMVHNGIEYGFMQAIAEGYGVLAKSPYHLNLGSVSNIYLQGSIISSFLIWTAREALAKDPTLSGVSGVIGANGEGKWTLEQAHESHVPAPVIEASVAFREKSAYDKAIQETFVAKLVQALRHEFGGHEEIKQDEKK